MRDSILDSFSHKIRLQMDRFNEDGLVIVPRDEEGVPSILDSTAVSLHQLLQEYRIHAESKGGLGLRKENGFRELVQKDVGRFDLNLDHLLKGQCKTEAEQRLLDTFHFVKERIHSRLCATLSDQYIVNAFGAVVSHPGTEAQRWHVDVSHLFVGTTTESHVCKLPCHFVTVFCPLYEFSEEIGPTEIALRSRTLTGILENAKVEDQYPADDIVDTILNNDGVEVIKLRARVGDIAIMDGRTLHRGTSNQSTEVRPLLYLSFCRPWYYEFPRSQNEGRSLFD